MKVYYKYLYYIAKIYVDITYILKLYYFYYLFNIYNAIHSCIYIFKLNNPKEIY